MGLFKRITSSVRNRHVHVDFINIPLLMCTILTLAQFSVSVLILSGGA